MSAHPDDVERLLAYEQIRQLASRYAVALDSRDLDALVALFVPDVRVGPEHNGRDALRNDFDRQLRGIGISVLHVTNQVIDLLDADHAQGVVYCLGEIQDVGRWITQAIRYDDQYERRDGSWLFARRKHSLFYGAELGENPLDLPPAHWPRNHTGRGTLPESLDTWRRFWNES